MLAENDEQVYEYIDKVYNYGCWSDQDKEAYEDGFKEKIIDLKGQMFDEDYEITDRYYGVTVFGWELVEENSQSDYTELINCGIIKIAPLNQDFLNTKANSVQ